jgi:DNA-binding GntR family transcriptional regulator
MKEKLEHPSLKALVEDAIEKKILSGSLKPGEKIAEIELAESFGVSRTPIKTSLIELAKEGLIELIPRRGAFVKVFTKEDMKKIREVRAALEGLAGKLAVDHATVTIFTRLENCISAYEEESKLYLTADTQEEKQRHEENITTLDIQFHNLILETSRNEYLMELATKKHIQFQCFINRSYDDLNFQRVVQEHTNIVSALKHKDKQHIETLLVSHVKGTGDK